VRRAKYILSNKPKETLRSQMHNENVFLKLYGLLLFMLFKYPKSDKESYLKESSILRELNE